MRSYILSVLVNNNFGVLTRISGLFARRGYNIKSLTVGETLDPTVSRMTIECVGDDHTLSQIQSQLKKVEDVISVKELEKETSVYRELFLVRVSCPSDLLADVIRQFDCRILAETETDTVCEVCGEKADFERFCSITSDYGKIDVARTGVTAI